MSTGPHTFNAKTLEEQKREDQKRLLQRTGMLPNAWLEQQLPRLQETVEKNTGLQVKFNEAMLDIQRLVVQGKSADPAALSAAVDKLKGLAVQADHLNASGVGGDIAAGRSGGGERITGGVQHALAGVESAGSSHSTNGSSGVFDVTTKINNRKKYNELLKHKDGASAPGSTKPQDGMSVTNAKSATPVTAKEAVAAPTKDTAPTSSGAVKSSDALSPKERMRFALKGEKIDTPAHVAEAIPKAPSPNGETYRAGHVLKTIGGDAAPTEPKLAEVAATKPAPGVVNRPQVRTASVATAHPA